jgi:hypothetical protein
MAIVQMIPPGDGKPHAITFNGRTYASTPGMAIPVPDFDAAILGANGWVQIVQATTAGQVQEAEVSAIRSGLAYKAASPSSFTVPAGALGVWSMIRTANYGGPCLNLRRSSDNATQDIGFLGDVVDYAAADAFVGAGNTGFVAALYDQSGSGHNLTQAVQANQPPFVRVSQRNGIRPFTVPNPGATGLPAAFLENAVVSYNSSSCTLVTVAFPRESYNTCAYWRGAATSVGADVLWTATALSALLVGSNGLTGLVNTGQVPIAGIKVAAVSYGAATTLDFDGIQTVLGAATSNALGYVSFGNFLVTSPTQYNFHGDYFFAALYPTAFTAAQLLTLRTTFNAFVPPVPATKNIVWGGNSIDAAFRGTNAKAIPYVVGFGRATVDDGALAQPALPDWALYHLAVGGRTLAAEYAARAVWLTAGFDATKSKNVYMMGDPTNDISLSGGYASTLAAQIAMNTLYTGTLKPYIAAVYAAGYSAIVVPTIISRGDIPFQYLSGNFMDDARIYWNALMRSFASANAIIVSDRASNPAFSATTAYLNTTYYAADKTHPTDAGNIILAGIDRAAILSA